MGGKGVWGEFRPLHSIFCINGQNMRNGGASKIDIIALEAHSVGGRAFPKPSGFLIWMVLRPFSGEIMETVDVL